MGLAPGSRCNSRKPMLFLLFDTSIRRVQFSKGIFQQRMGGAEDNSIDIES
jgi:hypothetical protein